MKTTAKKDGDDWILNGSKVFITNGYMADLAIVVARTDPNAKTAAHGTSLFLVEAGTPGFNKGKKLHKMGMKAQVSQYVLSSINAPFVKKNNSVLKICLNLVVRERKLFTNLSV